MGKLNKFLCLIVGINILGIVFADPSSNTVNAPINSDLSLYSPTEAPVTNITDTQQDTNSENSKQIQQLQQSMTSLQNQVVIQGHQLTELELRLQAIEIAIGQSPHAQSASLDDQKKNFPAITNNLINKLSNDDSIEAQKLYKTAMQQMQEKNYTDSQASLLAYINQYPHASLIADAQYWLGEVYAIQGDNIKARQQFVTVTKQYPQSDVAANAMLNLGTIAFSQSDYSNAKDWFSKIAQDYPETPAAQSANNQLNMLKKAGY